MDFKVNYDVIIRTLNSDSTLENTLDSVKRQSLTPSNIIIVDSGSVDNTQVIAKRSGALVVTYPNGEPFNYSRAINIGIEKASSDWCLIISSHSIFPELAETMEITISRLNADDLYCGCYFTSLKNELKVFSCEDIDRHNFNGFNGLFNSCSVVRRSMVLDHIFDEKLAACEDQYWANDMFNLGRKILYVKWPNTTYLNPRKSAFKEARDQVIISRLLRQDRRKIGFLSKILIKAVKNAFSGNFTKAKARVLYIILVFVDSIYSINFSSRY
jgi:glycosyltransferase involved in cell wall biosynthesis